MSDSRVGDASVCPSLDLDAITFWVGLSSPTCISRGEFAATVATPRILDLLDRRSQALSRSARPGPRADIVAVGQRWIDDLDFMTEHVDRAKELDLPFETMSEAADDWKAGH